VAKSSAFAIASDDKSMQVPFMCMLTVSFITLFLLSAGVELMSQPVFQAINAILIIFGMTAFVDGGESQELMESVAHWITGIAVVLAIISMLSKLI
jgi:hypothetical protein